MIRLILPLLFLATAAQAAPFSLGNPELGRQLYIRHDCASCHIKRIGGDGSGVFARPDHKVQDPASLLKQMKYCAGAAGISLSTEDEQHLGAYLNQQFYHFQ